MPILTVKLQTTARKVVLLAAALAMLGANYYFAKWSVANMASTHADAIEVADLATQMGPDDPLTHYAAAAFHEKTFLPEDIGRSLSEYETAAALSPNNYLFWLDLGNARGRSGDAAGAESALRKALALAPNYSSVHWALGNALLRQGKEEEAFVEIRKASAEDEKFNAPAADIAWQYFEGDVSRIGQAAGDSPSLTAALIPHLLTEKRIDDALALWNSFPAENKSTTLKQSGLSLYGGLIASKRFRDALHVYTSISTDGNFGVGKISNGDFEGDIKPQDAAIFEWQIGDGLQPQIVLTDGQKHSGSRSLWIIFNTMEAKDFRQISQTVAVEPGKTYGFEAFYKADLKTSISLKWEIASASDGKVIAATSKIANTGDWAPLNVEFSVPAGTDGVVIRLARDNCASAVCPISGKLWFDDISLKAK